nr:MAG TPA: hypothetical protein [Caudoviricetes sp.]
MYYKKTFKVSINRNIYVVVLYYNNIFYYTTRTIKSS